ncbi:MAG: MBL fold metallo-hydrolase [Betaproteobacteria bacterium]|nr:MBL fold metallo-hydrolase [Betaproteobacteria bacterium]
MSERDLVVADRVEVLILVDNVTDNLSSVPDYVENELPRLLKRGLQRLSGRCLCCGAHGLSCAITAWRGDTAHTLLFDTGPDDWVFERNVDRLGFDMGSVEAMVLSHGHWDHCGAMVRALEMLPRVTAFETGMPGQYRRTEDGKDWEPDPLLVDERFVAVNVKDKGVIVFTACSHAGVVNVLTHARDCFPGVPLHGVLGGFHLSGANERVIPETVAAMSAF